MSYQSLLDQTVAGRRLSPTDAEMLLREAPWTALAEAAHAVRLRMNDPETVG